MPILFPLISAPVFLITLFLMEFLMCFSLSICYTQAEHMQLYTHKGGAVPSFFPQQQL